MAKIWFWKNCQNRNMSIVLIMLIDVAAKYIKTKINTLLAISLWMSVLVRLRVIKKRTMRNSFPMA